MQQAKAATVIVLVHAVNRSQGSTPYTYPVFCLRKFETQVASIHSSVISSSYRLRGQSILVEGIVAVEEEGTH